MTRVGATPRVPEDFGDWLGEARAVRHGFALVDAAHLAVLRVGGRDGRDFLHRMLSADLRRLPPGRAVPAALLTQKARVVSTMTVVPRETETLCLLAREHIDRVAEHLDRFIVADRVELSASPHAALGLYGPGLRDCAELGSLAQLEAYRLAEASLCQLQCLVVGDDHLATPGLLVLADPAERDLLVRGLEGLGARRCGWRAYESCRVEAGTPAMGAELSEEVLILEAGQLACVSFDKGCYPGQEPVCRAHSRGQLSRRLVGLSLEGERVPGCGETLRHPEKTDAGRVTSAAWSAECERPLALAYVHRRLVAPGTALELSGRGLARVVGLPHVATEVWPLTCPRYKE